MDNRKELRETVAEKTKITIEDLYLFHFINDIYASTNSLVFIVSKCSKKDNTYRSELYTMSKKSKEKKLLYQGKIKKILWANDEEIVFSIKTEDKNIEIISIRNDFEKESEREAEVKSLFKSEEKLEDAFFTKNADIVFSKRIHLSDDHNEEEYKIFEELPFWSNSKKIIDKTRVKLYVKNNEGEEIAFIKEENAELISYALSPSHKKIAFIQNEFEGVDYTNHSLFLADLEERKISKLKENSNDELSNLCFFDEENLFYTSNDLAFAGKNPESYRIDLISKKEYKLPYQDGAFSGSPVTDMAYGKRANRLLSDGESIYFTRSVINEVHLFKMHKDGSVKKISGGNQSILDFSIGENDIYIISMKNTELPEIYQIDLENGSNEAGDKEIKISQINEEYNKKYNIIKPEKFSFINRDGIEMEVFVLLPNNIKEGEKVPVILQVHGGPKAVYTDMFYHEFQVQANMGYASVYSNPRGSDGRGSDFANIDGELGYMDYKDIIEAFDEALERYPILDKNRCAISGGSYGGFITNWAIGHTSRFKAACSQRSISNYLSKVFTTDIGYYHNLKQLEASPWEDIERFEMHSPISYAKNAKTPTLFIHSDDDYRCWQSEGIAMYNALKENGCEARFCLLYGENHGLSRGGRPHNRIVRLREIVNWIKRFC